MAAGLTKWRGVAGVSYLGNQAPCEPKGWLACVGMGWVPAIAVKQGMSSTRRTKVGVRGGKVTTGQKEGGSLLTSLKATLGTPMVQMENTLGVVSLWAPGRAPLWGQQACLRAMLAALLGTIPDRRNDPMSLVLRTLTQH